MLTLVRYTRTETAILGSLYLNGAFICYTLENAANAIPCGLYTVQNSQSPKFKRELPLIWNAEVQAKRGVRVHRGNSYSDSSACVLVGMGRDDKYIPSQRQNSASKRFTSFAHPIQGTFLFFFTIYLPQFSFMYFFSASLFLLLLHLQMFSKSHRQQ